MPGLQTEYEFTLPKGFVDSDGTLHRTGTMRLATARDEIEPLRDPAVTDADDPYLTIIVLSRVITALGSKTSVATTDVEGLFAADLAFLQDFYGIINFGDPADLEALQRAAVPEVEPEPADPDPDPDAGIVTEEVESPPKRSRRAQIEEVPVSES
ncbi:MAG: hypothetical protein OES13_10385 [Acidimicrobiia bacterium]|nr:hypothetical protein [Acidimicrobiia bacterium]